MVIMPAKKKEETFEVEAIVDSRMVGKKKEYLVKWEGYASKHNTWEPPSNLEAVKDMVAAFEKPAGSKRKEPEKPAPKKAASKSPVKPPAKRPKVAGTRAMTTKPKRGSAGKRAPAEPAPEPAPAKKQKTSPAPAKAKAAEKKEKEVMDVKELAIQLMAELKAAAKGGKAEPKPAKAPKKAEKASKPAKKVKEAKAPRSRKPKGEAAVVEVDKILAMKPGKGGGLSYQILWQDGTKSWEPEDNVMDDDLVDEFEEEEQAKAYSSEKISVGDEVEVKNVIDGFENSWSEAVIKKKTGSKFTVEFSGFVNDKGEGEVEAGIERKRLRLVPDAAEKGWLPIAGEIIEVNEDDCWWEARVLEVSGKKASLKFRVSDEVKPATLGTKKLRPCSWLTMKK